MTTSAPRTIACAAGDLPYYITRNLADVSGGLPASPTARMPRVQVNCSHDTRVGYSGRMAYLAPLLTAALFICGVVVWRLQLVAKRRFEVAEQTLTAFYRASEGLSRLRAPILWAGELANFDIPKDRDKNDERRVRDHGVYAARAEAAAPTFAELRTAQILAEIHLGHSVAQAIDVLFRGRQEVFAAVEALYRAGLDGPVVANTRTFRRR